MSWPAASRYFPVPPFELSGTVYCTLLNHSSAVDVLGDRVAAPPYGAAPKAPVLYVKPRNTLASSGDTVVVPRDVLELETAACLGIVLARTACKVAVEAALEYVAGYIIVNDVSVPHPNYYRPALRYKARDGFCPLGSFISSSSIDPDALEIRTLVDGKLVRAASTRDLVRSVARLVADVTEFMTLSPGDVLATGAAAPVPRVRAGQRVTIQIDGLEALSNPFVSADP